MLLLLLWTMKGTVSLVSAPYNYFMRTVADPIRSAAMLQTITENITFEKEIGCMKDAIKSYASINFLERR